MGFIQHSRFGANSLIFLLIVILIVISLPSVGHCVEPIDALQNALDEGIGTLKDPRYGDASQKDRQRERLWSTVQKIFDFTEFSKQALGRHWRVFTTGQKEEFIFVFTSFLRRAYLRKMQRRYNDEKVVYVTQDMITDTRALVKTKIHWKNLEIPVSIRMVKRDGAWRAYDVIILGISVAMNYRAQFNAILRKKSPAQLIERIRKRIAEPPGR